MATNHPPDIRKLLEDEELRSDSGETRALRAVTWWGPIALTTSILIVVAVMSGTAAAGKLATTAALVFFVFGKFAVLFGVGADSPFGPYEIASIVAYMDITIATLLVANLPRLYRLPRLGPIVEELAEHGLYMLERSRWLGRMTMFGVALFVMFPLTGTGAIGGSIFGRLLGLSALRTMTAIAIGALVGSFGMAYFADRLRGVFTEELRESWQFQAVGAAVVAGLVALVWWHGRRVSREIRARREAGGRHGEP